MIPITASTSKPNARAAVTAAFLLLFLFFGLISLFFSVAGFGLGAVRFGGLGLQHEEGGRPPAAAIAPGTGARVKALVGTASPAAMPTARSAQPKA